MKGYEKLRKEKVLRESVHVKNGLAKIEYYSKREEFQNWF
jgi:hypothetical protein